MDAVPFDGFRHGTHRVPVLDVQIQFRAGKGCDELVESRYRFDAADAGLGNLVTGQLGDPPCSIRHPVQRGVMENHQKPVRGRVDIGLNVDGPQLNSCVEGCHRVLQPIQENPRWANARGPKEPSLRRK